MFCRIYEPGKLLVKNARRLNEMFFVAKGSLVFYDRNGVHFFMKLPESSVFGDYQILFNLKTNFVVKAGGRERFNSAVAAYNDTCYSNTMLMCIDKRILKRLLD